MRRTKTRTLPHRDFGNALFVGAGPAGLAPLIWAARTGALSALAERGLAVVDPSAEPGAGRIGHAIHSDTAASTFLECLEDGAAPHLSAVRQHPVARRIAHYGQGSMPLAEVADFLREVGRAMVSTLRDYHVPVIAGRALASRRTGSGWQTEIETASGRQNLSSRALVLATGATQDDDRIAAVRIGATPLPSLGDRLLHSDVALSARGLDEMRERLVGRVNPTIAIIGGSHSALASAWRVLHELNDIPLDVGSVAILHRRPLRPFYASPDQARADGFVDFTDADICPLTGRLFRLAGFRFRARELVCQALGVGGAPPEPRLRLLQLTPRNVAAAEDRLRHADLVIAALGYRASALPLFDQHGGQITLRNADAQGSALVDDACRVRDARGEIVPDVFALGLAAGFCPSGPLGGEPSFRGQTNGLWLWQNGVGERIVRQLLNPAGQA